MIRKEILKLVLIVMLIPAIASAQIDMKILQDDNNIKFVIKNIGNDPIYVLNYLEISGSDVNIIYTSRDKSSAEVLKIFPGASYTFEYNTDDIEPGTYNAKIYQGKYKSTLKSAMYKFDIWPGTSKVSFYTNKMSYKYGENVDITFKNKGHDIVYINVNDWKIKNVDTGDVVATLSTCGNFGYGCADSFEPLEHMQYVKQTWDQKDTSGNQVSTGKYIASAEYKHDDGIVHTIDTRAFYIRQLVPSPTGTIPRPTLTVPRPTWTIPYPR